MSSGRKPTSVDQRSTNVDFLYHAIVLCLKMSLNFFRTQNYKKNGNYEGLYISSTQVGTTNLSGRRPHLRDTLFKTGDEIRG